MDLISFLLGAAVLSFLSGGRQNQQGKHFEILANDSV